MFAKFGESQIYFRTRDIFIWRAIWKFLSILAGFYSGVSVIVAPFILASWLPAEEWIRMSLFFWSIILAVFVLVLFLVFICSFFRKGQKINDYLIKYPKVGIEERLANIEARLDNIETRLGKVEDDLGEVKRRLSNLERRVDIIEKRVNVIEKRLG
jgi:hypothetical protein